MLYFKECNNEEGTYKSYDPDIRRWKESIVLDVPLVQELEEIAYLQGKRNTLLLYIQSPLETLRFVDHYYSEKMEGELSKEDYLTQLLSAEGYADQAPWKIVTKAKQPLTDYMLQYGKKYCQQSQLRSTQIWLGSKNIHTANYVPPKPEDISTYILRLETFLQNKEALPTLSFALSHAYLFLLLPFESNNSKFIRMFSHLLEAHLFRTPIAAPVSYSVYRHTSLYNNALSQIFETENITTWIHTFLRFYKGALTKQLHAMETLKTSFDDYTKALCELRKVSSHASALLEQLFCLPIIDVKATMKYTGLTKPNATQLVRTFEELGILTQITQGKRNRKFALSSFLDVLS